MRLIPLFARAPIGCRAALPADVKVGQYLAIGAPARLDAFFWGRRCAVEGKFQTDAFLSGLVANALIATVNLIAGSQTWDQSVFDGRSGDPMAYI